MIKNENFVNKNENLFLNQKRERNVESPNKYDLNSDNISITEQINPQKNLKYKNSDNSKIAKYEKYAKLIENFLFIKYGNTIIQESCFICCGSNFLSNELFYFENSVNLFYYLKYLFHKNISEFYISKEIFQENQEELNEYKKINFISNINFSTPKIICKQCFIKIINEKNFIQKIIKLFNDKNNDFDSNIINCIEIKKDESEVISSDNNIIKNKNVNDILNIKTNINNIKLINNDYNFNNINNSSNLNKNNNITEYIVNNNKKDFFKTNNNENDFELKNIISNNFSNLINCNKYNIVINDNILFKNNITINNNEKEKINSNEFPKLIHNENKSNNTLNNFIFNDNFLKKEESLKDLKNIKNYNINSLDSNFNKNNEFDLKSPLLINNQLNNLNKEIKNKNNKINNTKKNMNKNNEIEENKIKYLFSNNFIELILCLNELKDKISKIIQLSQKLKYQYDFLINYHPNLFDIIFSYKKSFFLLYFVASSEILNNLVLSYNYILQRINILIKILNFFESNPNLSKEQINEIKNLKKNIDNILLKAEKNNKNFQQVMNNFLIFLKDFMKINDEIKKNE